MTIQEFNHLEPEQAETLLLSACHSPRWAQGVVGRRPYLSVPALLQNAESIWEGMEEADFLEAFAAHPKIGDVNSLKAKYRGTAAAAAHEQSGAAAASDETLRELARLNTEYDAKFGFIFIVFATGKTADQMLSLLQDRIGNTREEELENAAREQAKIMRLRLEKLL